MSDDQQRPRRRRPRPNASQRTRQRHWTDYLPLASVAALLLAVAIVAIVAIRWLSPAGRPVTVPTLTGVSFDHAKTLAATAYIGLRVVAHRSDFHAPKGVIIGQLPGAGEKVREGRVVDVILSDGVPVVKIPNLSNFSLRDARLALENAHLAVGKVTESENLNVIAGQVLGQHPDPFTSVAAGSHVDVVVAQGRPQMYAPSFVGMSIAFAKQAAKDAHVAIGGITQMPITAGAKPLGTVVAQDPVAGQRLTPKERVSLRVSGGAPATPTPLPTQSALAALPSPSPSASPLLPSPAAQRVVRISVALPLSDAPKAVRVVLEDATGSKTLFDQTTVGGITLSFDLQVVGQATIETYVNGKLVSTTPL